MSVNIEMPKLSDTMTEGTVVKWHKQVGDSVEIGDVLADIETDKATMEMEAFDDGVISEIKVKEGEKAPIGATLAVLGGDSESAPEPEAQQQAESPAAEEEAEEEEAPAQQPQEEPAAATPAATTEKEGERILASPLARKVAAELGIDLSSVSGTGPAGRITRSDVEDAGSAPQKQAPAEPEKAAPSSEATAAAKLAASVKSKAATPAQAPAAPAAAPQAILPVVKSGDEKIELSTMRKIIASRLLISKTTIPHFYLHVEVDAEPLMALRKQVNDQAEKTHGNKYSVNDFILKAVINAAQAVPAINASFAGDHIVKFKPCRPLRRHRGRGRARHPGHQGGGKQITARHFPPSRISPSVRRTRNSSPTNSTAAPSPSPTSAHGASSPSMPSSIRRKPPSSRSEPRSKSRSSRTARSSPACA
jgi:pyruvate dehydrogenase E2 component (dihydrolipoamide acetyltransferase)